MVVDKAALAHRIGDGLQFLLGKCVVVIGRQPLVVSPEACLNVPPVRRQIAVGIFRNRGLFKRAKLMYNGT